jgi:hypothetical protein
MHSFTHGRFTSPDPIMISLDRLVNPQMINLYVYAVNNPFSYTDSDGEKPYQLGQASLDSIKKSIKDTEALLKKDKKNQGLIDQLASLKNDRDIVTVGNKVVGAWLKALTKAGEDQGMKIEDFKIATDPVNDLTAAVQTAKAQGLEGGNINLDAGKLLWGMRSTTGSVVGNDVYILTPSDTYQEAARLIATGDAVSINGKEVPNSDVFLFGGSALLHEEDHRRNKSNEVSAYGVQINFLTNMDARKQFKNQDYLNGIKKQLNDRRNACVRIGC